MILIMFVAHFHYVSKYGAVFAFICCLLLLGWSVILDLHIMNSGQVHFYGYIYWSKYYILSMHLLDLQECLVVYLIIQMNLSLYNAIETFGSVNYSYFWYLYLFLIFIGLLFKNKRKIAKQRGKIKKAKGTIPPFRSY